MADIDFIKNHLTTHPDFPKKVDCSIHDIPCNAVSQNQGIAFLDIFPILRNPIAFETLITHLVHHLTSSTICKSPSGKIDAVVGLDARGFLLGPIIALRLGAAFVPVRKKGKLPGQCVMATYDSEYSTVSAKLLDI